MWIVIAGIVILLISSFLHSYCSIGVQCLLSLRPMIFDSFVSKLLQIGWIVLFVIGVVLLFFENWIWGIVAIAVYWLLLPLLVTPIVRKRMLPPWGEVKDTLEELGYTKDNYLDGDWWKTPEHKHKCDKQ